MCEPRFTEAEVAAWTKEQLDIDNNNNNNNNNEEEEEDSVSSLASRIKEMREREEAHDKASIAGGDFTSQASVGKTGHGTAVTAGVVAAYAVAREEDEGEGGEEKKGKRGKKRKRRSRSPAAAAAAAAAVPRVSLHLELNLTRRLRRRHVRLGERAYR